MTPYMLIVEEKRESGILKISTVTMIRGWCHQADRDHRAGSMNFFRPSSRVVERASEREGGAMEREREAAARERGGRGARGGRQEEGEVVQETE